MSKKKFKAGLESLFGDVGEDKLIGIQPLLDEEQPSEQKTKTSSRKNTKRKSRKNFSSNLEDLFHDALDKEYKDKVDKTSFSKGRDTIAKKRNERPVIGIDALIRRTTEEKQENLHVNINAPLKKRVTLTLEKNKLEKLKSIAKSKKAYLKDIVDEIISDFLNEQAHQQ